MGRQPAVAHPLVEELAEGFVDQRGGGQVDRAGMHLGGGLGPRLQPGQRQVDHVPVERDAQLETLGGGNEVIGRQPLRSWALPPKGASAALPPAPA